MSTVIGGLTALGDDDVFEQPITTVTPVSAEVPAGEPGQNPAAPAANSDAAAAAAAERWARRSQRLREAAVQGEAAPSDAALQPHPAPVPRYLPNALPQFPAPALNPGRASTLMTAAPLPGQPGYKGMALPGATDALPPAVDKVRRPSELPKVTQISPYTDYEPDPAVARTNPCQNLCPTPDGSPCKSADGTTLECPKEIALSEGPYQPPSFSPSVYAWQASNICYNPLYFEDPDLERYGHTWPFLVQPLVSSLRMTIQAAGIPYQMVLNPCHSAVYPLGFYRPGDCAPKLIYQIPWNCEAAVVEAAAITGVYFMIAPAGSL
jgi:hypothetical protein